MMANIRSYIERIPRIVQAYKTAVRKVVVPRFDLLYGNT
jgi:hypothetical protein